MVCSGPRSTPFFNDSCSDTETTAGDVESILQTRNDSKHFIHIKEEMETETHFYKCGNVNNPLHTFSGE